MLQEELMERLLRLDEDASLLFGTSPRCRIIIVGGSALILMGRLSRATHNLDALSVPAQLMGLLERYDINTAAEAYINNFPYNYEDRLLPISLPTKLIDYFTPCLEDMVVAKLCSNRDTDLHDIELPSVREHINWNLLEHLALDENEAHASALNDRCYEEFLFHYRNYAERWKPCEN